MHSEGSVYRHGVCATIHGKLNGMLHAYILCVQVMSRVDVDAFWNHGLCSKLSGGEWIGNEIVGRVPMGTLEEEKERQ